MEPIVSNKGIILFKDGVVDADPRLIDTHKLSDDIVQMRYGVKK